MNKLGSGQGSIDIVILFTVVFLGAVAFANAGGTSDVGIWLQHMAVFRRDGLLQGYAHINDDIPPLGGALLWLMSTIARATGLPAMAVLRGTLVTATMISVQAFYGWTRSPLLGLGLFAAILLNVTLGYLDVLYLPFLLWSLRDLQAARYRRGAVLYGLASLIKWQPLIAGPFFFLHMVLPGWRAGLRNVVPALLVGLAIVVGFGVVEPLHALWRAMRQNYISGQALNLMWLVTALLQYAGIGGSSLQDGLVHWQVDFPSGGIEIASKLLFFSVYGALVWRFVYSDRSFATTLLFATAGFLSYFAFGFTVHENHLFVGSVLALAAGYLMPRMRFLAAVIIGLSAMNLVLFYGLGGTGLGFSRIYGVDISILFAVVTVAVSLRYWAIAIFYRAEATSSCGE